MINVKEVFEKYEDDYCKFEKVTNPPCKRADVAAFIFLDQLVPGDREIIVQSEHDEITLEIDIEELAKVATEEDIQRLAMCGVRYDSYYDSLKMFV